MKKILFLGVGLFLVVFWIRAAEKPAGKISLTKAEMELVKRADAEDGKVDGVVKQCSSCSLMMGGLKEHAIKVDGVEFHFCSKLCKKAFIENHAKIIQAFQE